MLIEPIHRYGWLAAALLLSCCCAAGACRYSVRDVLFVGLAPSPYVLTAVLDESSPTALRDAIRIAGATVALDANVRVLARMRDEIPAELLAALGDNATPPMLVLSRRVGQTLRLPLEPTADGAGRSIDAALASPARQALAQHLPEAYCVVLLVEGTDAQQNARVRGAVDGAIAATNKAIPDMPKPTKFGPRLVTITAEQFDRERVLLWSLDLPARPQRDPAVAIIAGRGRLFGPVIDGLTLTQTDLTDTLRLLGQDCECELDRRWVHGPAMPLVWDDDARRRTGAALGFDPDDASVRAEVRRIISRGPIPASDLARGVPSDGVRISRLAATYQEGVTQPPRPSEFDEGDAAPFPDAGVLLPRDAPTAAARDAGDGPSSKTPGAPAAPAVTDYSKSARTSLLWIAAVTVGVVAIVVVAAGIVVRRANASR